MPVKKKICEFWVENKTGVPITIARTLVQHKQFVEVYDMETLQNIAKRHNGGVLFVHQIPNVFNHLFNTPVKEANIDKPIYEELITHDKTVAKEVVEVEVVIDEVVEVVGDLPLDERAIELPSITVNEIDTMTKEEVTLFATSNDITIVVGKRTSVETARARLKEALGFNTPSEE
jgi:hypothetical protein